MDIDFRIEGIMPMYRALGKKKKLLIKGVKGETVRDLTDHLIKKYGPAVKAALMDKFGKIDMEFRVAVNMKDFLQYGKRMNVRLNDGDILHIMTAG